MISTAFLKGLCFTSHYSLGKNQSSGRHFFDIFFGIVIGFITFHYSLGIFMPSGRDIYEEIFRGVNNQQIR